MKSLVIIAIAYFMVLGFVVNVCYIYDNYIRRR